jgi:hypothetical protein
MGSTRHNEEKYTFFANEIKRAILMQYPVIKVIMKPLIFDHNEQTTEAVYLGNRIGSCSHYYSFLGCLEVQIYSKDSKGHVHKDTIFSKLKSRFWPSISTVVSSLSEFLPKDDIIIRLIDPKAEQIYDKGNPTDPSK